MLNNNTIIKNRYYISKRGEVATEQHWKYWVTYVFYAEIGYLTKKTDKRPSDWWQRTINVLGLQECDQYGNIDDNL